MTLLHIDDRLARLAEAAARTSIGPRALRRPHEVRIAAAPGGADAAADALRSTGRLLEALARSDGDDFCALCLPGTHLRTPTVDVADVHAVASPMFGVRHGFTGVEVSIGWFVASSRQIAAEWTIRATHTGPLHVDWAVIDATGQSITLDGMLMAELDISDPTRGPLFADLHLQYDTAGLLLQLGLA